MKKNIEIKIIVGALDRVREQFYDFGSEIMEKISNYRETGSISGKLGDPSFDYAQFSEVMKGSFHSVALQLMFESMVYLHYFSDVHEMILDINNFISHRKFDRKSFDEIANRYIDLSVDLDIIRLYVHRNIRNLGVKPEICKKILRSGDQIHETLKVLKHAMTEDLHHYGNKNFLVSKIPINGDHPFDKELALNPHIFYTDDPEKILALAHRAKPGVYIIANVPYGNHAETAFYILFRQEGYAYLVENSKHSYREQYYRTKSNGTAGKDAWLGRKYEYCYFPIDVVMDFFEDKSEGTAVQIPGSADFISLGKITDGTSETILYTYAFIDRCLSFLMDSEFASQISNTFCAGYMVQLMNTKEGNVPAIASSLLPSINDLDMSWSPDKVGVKDASEIFSIVEGELPALKDTELTNLSLGSLTSLEHLERAVAYQNRLKSAKALEGEWIEDYKKNHKLVFDSISEFINKRGLNFVVKKSFKDLIYPLRTYPQFGRSAQSPNNSGYIDTTILSGWDRKTKGSNGRSLSTHSLSGYNQIHYSNLSTNFRSFEFSNSWCKGMRLCDACDSTYARHFYTLQFLDWDIFKLFFEIQEDEMIHIPDQLKKYLNQSMTAYFGNSILNDLDPITLIKNPWFLASIDDSGEVLFNRNNPVFLVNFYLCGNCLNKIKKR